MSADTLKRKASSKKQEINLHLLDCYTVREAGFLPAGAVIWMNWIDKERSEGQIFLTLAKGVLCMVRVKNGFLVGMKREVHSLDQISWLGICAVWHPAGRLL